jgi:hypothetical protein
VVWVLVVGVTAAVLWEFYEWIIEQIRPAAMRVDYTDTVVDLFAGTLWSLVAGRWRARPLVGTDARRGARRHPASCAHLTLPQPDRWSPRP